MGAFSWHYSPHSISLFLGWGILGTGLGWAAPGHPRPHKVGRVFYCSLEPEEEGARDAGCECLAGTPPGAGWPLFAPHYPKI